MRLKTRNTANKAGIGIGGKIKIGEKRQGQNGKEYPVSLDYFIPYSDNAEYEHAFREQIGEKPDSLKIVFLDDNAVNECLELRDNSGSRAAYSDGETIWKIDLEAKKFIQVDPMKIEKNGGHEAIMAAMAAHYKGQWRHTLTMRFVLIGLKGILCQWELRTHGTASSINNIIGAFDNMKQSLGTSVGIVWDLSIKKVKSDKAGIKSVYPVLSLTANMGAKSIKALSGYMKAGQITAKDLLAIDETSFQSLESNINKKQLPQPKTIELK